MPLAEAEARRIVAYRLSVSVLSQASLASTLLWSVPSRLACTGDPVSTRCLGCLTRPGLGGTSTLPSVLLPRYSTSTYMYLHSTYLTLVVLTLPHLHRPHIAAANSLASSAPVERCRPGSVISSQRGGGIIVIDSTSYGTGKVR